MLPRRVISRSFWSRASLAPPDAILGVTEAFKADGNPSKLNLGVGSYRNGQGLPHILPAVMAAEAAVLREQNEMEYAGIDGIPAFTQVASKLAFGEDLVNELGGSLVAAQAISGTGALRLAGAMAERFAKAPIYLPTPSWGNHKPIFVDAGLEVRQYSYYDPATVGLDFAGMCADIGAAPEGSIIVLHACAHNPTGIDPNMEQWKEISALCKKRNHLVLFDMAYQGFASGDPTKDAAAMRYFVQDGHKIMLCQSFAKNFGLYGHRTGCFYIVGQDADEATRVKSQLKRIIRPMYSNPPIHGARVVTKILNDPQLTQQWADDVAEMANRINGVRNKLRAGLEERGSARSWQHITDQIGMFTYTGLKPEEVERIQKEYSVYLTSDGRVSMAGVTSHNVEYLAEAIHSVTK